MEMSTTYAWKKEKNRNNSPLSPEDRRGLIVGKSNCGKTTLIINLLLNPGQLDYDHLFVSGRSFHQKEYVILKKDWNLAYLDNKFLIFSITNKK